MTTSEKTIKISTLCRDCIFATYSENFDKQIGCSHNRLEKFEKLGKVNHKTDKETGLEYCEITTVCNFHRTKEWGNYYEDHNGQIVLETTVKLDAILLVDDASLEDVKASLEHLKDNGINKVFIPYYKMSFPVKSLLSYLDSLGMKNEVIHLINNVFVQTDECLLNEAARKSNAMYYVVCKANELLPKHLVKKLDITLNYNLEQISMIKPLESNLHGLVMQVKLHKLLNGFSPQQSLVDRVMKLAEEQNLEHMVRLHD